MRVLTLAVAALLLAGFAPQTDWRNSVATAPSGAMLVGRPDAGTTLVEYLSYTCSHCATFVRESNPVLKDEMVRTGAVRVEYRNAVRDALDLAASIGTRCAGPKGFIRASDAVFANQAAILEKAQAMPEPAGTQTEKLQAIASGSGLAALLAANGVPAARLDQCLADPAQLKAVLALTGVAREKIRGTPSFEIDGELLADVHDWGNLAPRLRAATARSRSGD